MATGRNEPCPCGSGRKYKHCCLAARSARVESPENLVWRRLRRLKDEENEAALLLRFIERVYGEAAVDEAWAAFNLDASEPFDPESPYLPLFLSWMQGVWSPDPHATTVADASLHGVPPLRAFLARKGRHLDPLSRAYMEACLAAPFTFMEVLGCEPERSLRTRDIFTGEELEILERSATRFLDPGDLVYGQVAAVQGIRVLEAMGPVPLPPIHRIELVKLRQAMAQGSASPTPSLLAQFDDELRSTYLRLSEALLFPEFPVLQNTDGEALVPHRLVYDVESATQAFEALRDLGDDPTEPTRQEVEFAPDGTVRRAEIVWVRGDLTVGRRSPNTVLGHIRIDARRMVAEVNSAERAETLRQFVALSLGESARLRATEIQSVEKVLEDAPAAAPFMGGAATFPEGPGVPEALIAAVSQYLEGHYRNWIDEAIPALDGRTPRAAMRDPDGPEQVEALVRDIERSSTRMRPPPDPTVFRRLRESLGLPPAD